MNNTIAMKKPFPIAAVFFLIYGSFRLFVSIYRLYNNFIYGYNYNFLDDIIRLFIPFTFLALGIILIITRKNTIILPILFGVLMIVWDLYWLFSDLDYYFELITFNTISSLLSYFLDIAAFVLLILFSILSIVAKEKKCGFLIVWFIPGILFLISEALSHYYLFRDIEHLAHYFYNTDGIVSITTVILGFVLFVPSIFLFGYWLYKENKYKALCGAPMTIPSYSEDSAVPAFDPNIDTVPKSYTQVNTYNDQNSAPIQQTYTQTPAYNNQYNAPTQQGFNQAPMYNPQYTAPLQQPMYAQQPQVNQIHVTEEISRYKKLLDDGAITQEEYDIKKKQLLGL